MDDKPLFGIWIYNTGWLRVKDDFFADYSREKADEIARHIGAVVRFIDTSAEVNAVLETMYLQRESRSLWHFFKRLSAPSKNK